jgi:outer membrane protein assembly factor BamB
MKPSVFGHLPGVALVVAIVFCCSAKLQAENWPRWRGPNNDGISHETDLPSKWSKTENIAWRTPLPGSAGSTPIVWDDRIFLTSADGDDLVLCALNTDGEMLWKRTVSKGANKSVRRDEGNLASPSPSTDGKHVWVFMGTGDLACYDFEGNEVWKFNVQDRYGDFQILWSMASSPLLDGDRLYLGLMHRAGGKVVALDKLTGNEIWVQPRETDAIEECKESYASPVIYRDGRHEFLLTHGGDYLIAHRLEDGKELWRCGGLNIGRYNPTLRLVSTPVVVDGLIVVPSAKKGPVLGLSPTGEPTADGKMPPKWSLRTGTPDVPSPLVYEGLVYLCDEGGFLTCLDAATGEPYYSKKRVHADRHRASPLYADGKIYIAARDGTVSVVKPGKEFEILATNDMEESITASPVVSGGTLYLRTFDALYAIRK